MKLKRTITRTITKKQLDNLSKQNYILFNFKQLQSADTYLVSYVRYNSDSYEVIVNHLVKEKYSDSEEFAILRKTISNPNNDEYLIYNAYVEDCKIKARAFVEERDSKLARYNELELEV